LYLLGVDVGVSQSQEGDTELQEFDEFNFEEVEDMDAGQVGDDHWHP